jgi:hypothetical protein
VVITRHKWEVFKACWRAGLYWQGIVHDLSKYSPAEFIEYAHYFQGNSSPVDAAKREKGFCFAWLHHRGRNPHHYEYWVDDVDKGGRPLIMPYKYVMEMVCDWIGAGKCYNKKNWSKEEPLKYYTSKVRDKAAIHPKIKVFLDEILGYYSVWGDNMFRETNKRTLKFFYDTIVNEPEPQEALK